MQWKWGQDCSVRKHTLLTGADSITKHKDGHSSSHRASQNLSTTPTNSIYNVLSFGPTESRFYNILVCNTKTAEYRATGRPRSSRSEFSASNSILYRLGLPNHDSTTCYNGAQNWLSTEPHGTLEALDRSFRHQIQFSIVWARQITILRDSTMKYKSG